MEITPEMAAGLVALAAIGPKVIDALTARLSAKASVGKTEAEGVSVWIDNYNKMFKHDMERDDILSKVQKRLLDVETELAESKRSSALTIDALTSQRNLERDRADKAETALENVRRERNAKIEELEARIKELELFQKSHPLPLFPPIQESSSD
jgi:septal ring factor EnvC (AmiA/AmiB activator)